jgi:hypothetical protein
LTKCLEERIDVVKLQAEALAFKTHMKFMMMLDPNDPVRINWMKTEKEKFAIKMKMQETKKQSTLEEIVIDEYSEGETIESPITIGDLCVNESITESI